MRTLAVLGLAALTLTAGVTSAAANATPSHHKPHTKRVVVRPVRANGHAVHGYTVKRESFDGFTCDEGASPVAVDANIRFCGPSASYTVACWKSTHHTVLCLRNPRAKQLARIRYTGTFTHVAAPKHPSPQALRLFNGNYCLVRDGGAWGEVKGHPKWFGDYSCKHGIDVYGRGRDGIVRSVNPWRVHTVRDLGGNYVNRRVKIAYYVGTAH